jgi:hypothetical protein
MHQDIQLDPLQQEHIDHTLIEWHHWCSAESEAIGYPRTAAGCGMWRASRQYDDHNGSIDAYAENVICQAVDNLIAGMIDPYRSALHMEARNLVTARVWRSARVDQDRAEEIIQDARAMLWQRMAFNGLV